jgi:hypothetical protein
MTTKPLAWRTSPALHSQHDKAASYGITLPDGCTRELAQTIIDEAEKNARMARIEFLGAIEDGSIFEDDLFGPDDHDEEGA